MRTAKLWFDERVAIFTGLLFAVLPIFVGIALGVLVGQSLWAMRGLDPIFQVLRTISPLAWLPISLAAFRDSQPSAIFVIFITSVWPIIINTAVGIRNIPQDQMGPIMGIACPQIVYPYLRGNVADVIQRAGFPPVVLHHMDFNQIYAQAAQAQKAQQAQPAPATVN